MRAGYGRSRISRHPWARHLWKTTALTTLALGLSGVVAHGDPDGLWQPQIRAIIGADNNGGNAALEGFIPIKQTAESVLFLDVRAKHDFKDASGQDIGLGIRRIVNPDLMLGGYAYINLENDNSTQFTSATLGAEAITPNFDAHVNVFIPIKGDSADHSVNSTLSMVSNQLIEQISVLDHRDYAAWGIEGEIGAQVPINLPDKHSLRLDIGGYHFEDPHGDDGSVTGAKAGFEYTIGDVFGSGTELVLAGEVRNDNRDDTQFAGSVRLNIPFNPGHGSDTTASLPEPVYPVSEGLRKRVNERVRGDIGVRVQSQDKAGGSTTRPAINAATNAAFGKFYFADGGLAGAGTQADPTTLDDAVTKAGSGGFVVALGGDGNLTTAGVTLANGQTVIGGGESVTAKLFGGGTATFNLGGSDGTIEGTNVANPVIKLGNGNTLNGITITGGADGILGNNITGATLTNVTVTGAGGNGADFTGTSTGITGTNFTALGNGLDGLHIEGDGTYNFTGTTLLSGNQDDGLDITGKGTYNFAVLNAQNNQDAGITVKGTLVGGSFATTGGQVSGNKALGDDGVGIFIDPITAHVVLDSIDQDGGTSGVVLDHVKGSFTVNGTTTIKNTTGTAIAISNSVDPLAVRFGDIAITNPGGDGIAFTGANVTVVAGDIVIAGLGTGTGLDFSGSKVNFTAQSLNITGTGAAGSIGIDLTSPSVGGAVIAITDGGVITNVDTGVRLGIAGTPGATANAEFTFGGDSSSISGITASLDARGLNEGSGHYAFGTTQFTGPQLYDLRNYIFVAAGASGGGTSITDLASIDYADSITDSDAIIVLVNRGTIDDATGFSLSDGQELASFGNGREFSLGGVPLNVTGINVHHDESISDSAGAATLTSSGGGDVVTLGNGNTLLDFNISGGSGSAIYGLGINGLTVQGVTASNVGSGLYLNGVTGTVSVDDLTVQTASQTGIALVSSSATVNFTGNTKITSAASVGLYANNFDGIASFDDLDITGGGYGVAIRNASSGTLTFGTGSSIANTGNAAFDIVNSSPHVTYNGTIDQATAASAVNISNMTGGTATFGGKITASTGAVNAINLTGNAGGTISFTGGLDLATTTGTGFNATGGTINVAAAGTESIATGTGRAINLDGVTIGTGGMSFDSISTGVTTATALNFNAVSGGPFSGGNVSVGGSATNGLAISSSSASFTVTSLATSNVAGADVSLTNNTGSISILGGTITNSGTGDGVVVSGGSATIGVAANISSSATLPGTAVKVDGTTGGSVTFSGSVTSTGTGNLFVVGSVLPPTGGAISFTGPSLSAAGGGGVYVVGLAGTATLNVTAPLSITGATSTGLAIANVASTASATFGAVTVTGAGADGIGIANDAGSVTFGTTNITLGATAGAAGINFALTNADVSFGTTTVSNVGANQTGIDFSGSATAADFGVTTITGTGDLSSRGIDLSSTQGDKTITFQRGSSISNVGVGVELASDGTTATSANANFTFGDGTSADGLQSSISAAAGGYTVNTIGLDPTLGSYDFDDVAFTGAAHLVTAADAVIFVSQSGGPIAAGAFGLSKSVSTISVADADAMTGTHTFVFVGTVDLSATPFTLDSGQAIDGFGNGTSVIMSGTIQPVNVHGNLGASGGAVTGNEGVVKGAGDVLHLLGNNTVGNTAFELNGGSGSVFLVDGSAGGFANGGGITIDGVKVSNVAAGQTAFKVDDLTGNLSITNNNINVAGTLLDADGGAGDITVTRGNLPNSGPAGTLTGGGINLQNLTGTVTIGDGTLTNTGANTAFNVGSTTAGSGGSAVISYAGTIASNGTGAAVSIQSMTGGSVTLSGNLTDNNAAAGGNIVIAGNDSVTLTFSGATKQISSGAIDGVNIGWPGGVVSGVPKPNTNSAINFTNGGLDITTTTGGMGFVAFGGFSPGSLTVTGSGNKINSGGDGLLVAGTNVGVGGITFDSISAVSTVNAAGVFLSGLDLTGDVNIGGLTDTGYTGALLAGLTGAGVVNFTGTTDLDVSYRGFDIGGPKVGTINIANVAGSTLTIDGGEGGIVTSGLQEGIINVGGNGGDAKIGETTSTTGSAVALSGGNDLVHATLNYNGSIKVSAGSVVQAVADWSELNMSGSVDSTTAAAAPGTAAFVFSGNANGVYNISSSITHTGIGIGVLFDGSSEGTATFFGTSKIFNTSSGSNDAIVKAPSIGPGEGTGTLAFTGGNLVITTSSGAGFTASTFGAGTVSVSGTGNTITTGTGTALKLGDATAVVAGATGATVGADGIKFDTISTNGAATGISLNDVSGGAIDLGAVDLKNITSRGVDISGTLGSALDFDSLNIGIAASATNAVGLDLNGAALGTSPITAGDFDVDGGNSIGSIGIDMAGTTGTGTIQLGDLLNNNPGPAGQTSTITKVAQGVQFSSATNARLVFGDSAGPAESKIETFGNGQVIHATDTLPTSGDYNFNDVNFSGDTSNLSSYKVYYVTTDAAAGGDGSLLNPGTYANAQASSANVIVLIDKNVDGGQATIDLGGTSFQLDDGQVLLAFKSGDAAVDVSQLGVDTSAGASAAFHFTTVQNSPLIAAPAGIDTLRPILQSNNATQVISLATSGTGTVTGGIENLIVRNTGSGDGISVTAANASNFILRNNNIAAGGNALDFSTSGGLANTLLLSIDGNTLKSTGSALAASFSGQNIDPTDNSIAITSFATNKVTGGTGGGIAFTNVRFDSDGAGGIVSAGALGIGNPGARVQGNGLSFTSTSGTLDLGTLSLANDGGTGVISNTKTTNFTLNSSGGVVTTNNGAAFDLDPLTVNMTLTTVNASGGASGIIFDGVAGSFTVTGATSVTGTTGFGIDAEAGNTGTFNFNTLTVNNTATAGGGINVATGTLNVTGLANIDTSTGTGVSQGPGSTSFTGGLTIDTTSGDGFLGISAGSITVSGAGNSITTATGRVLSLQTAVIGAGGMKFDTLKATGTVGIGAGVQLATVSGGAFNGGAVSIAGTSNNALVVQNNTSSVVNFDSVVVSSASANGIYVVNGVTGPVTIGTVTIDNTVAAGVRVENTSGTLNINGGSIGATDDPTGSGIKVVGGAATVNVVASLTKTTAGKIVDISGVIGGTVTLTGALTANSASDNGIYVHGNSGGTFNFNGAMTLGTGTSQAVDLDTNAGATVNFTGGMGITTTSGLGFGATGGGAINVTGTNTIAASLGGRLLAWNGVTVGASGATFSTMSVIGIVTGGDAVNLTNVGGGTFNGGTLTVSGGTNSNGIVLDGTSGTVNFAKVTIGNQTTAATGGGIKIDNNTGAVTISDNTSVIGGFGAVQGIGIDINGGFGDVTIAASVSKGTVANNVVKISGRTGGTVTLSGTLNAGGNNGIDVSGNTSGTITFSGAGSALSTGANTAVNLTGNGAATTINFIGGGLNIDTTTGTGFNVSGSGNITVSGAGNTIDTTTGTAFANLSGNATITSNAVLTTSGAGRVVDIQSRTGNNVTLSGTITNTGSGALGINVQNNTAGTITFSGSSKKVTTTGTDTAVNLTGNNGATIDFASGGLVISTAAGIGFNATGVGPGATTGGTVTVQGTGNTITSTSGTALNIVNTTIGTNDVTFQSISSGTGSANGIILNNTGSSGGLHVTGVSANAGSGGTIQHKTGADGSTTQGTGIYLNNTFDVQLANMQLNDFQNFGIRGFDVNGFTLANSTVNATSGVNGTSAGADEGSISFRAADAAHNGLTGTVAITNSVIANGLEDNFNVFNNSGSLNITVSGSTFRDTSVGSPGNDGLLLQADNTANITGLVTNSSFLRNFARGIQVINNGSGNIDFDVGQAGVAGSGGTFTDNFVAVDMDQNGAGAYNFNVLNATFTTANYASLFGAGTAGSQINVNRGGAASPVARGLFTGNIDNNNINNADSGTGPGIWVSVNGTGTGSNTVTVKLDGNTVSHVQNYGIKIDNGDGNATVNATITNNTVTTTLAGGLEAIRVNDGLTSTQAGNGTPDNGTLNLDIRGNTLSASPTGGATDIRVRQRFNTTFTIEGYGGGATDDAAVQAYLASLNGHSGGGAATVTADHLNTGFGTFPAVPEPPLP